MGSVIAGSAPTRAGILGTGGVARLHAEALAGIDGARLSVVADSDWQRAADFAATHGSPLVLPTLEAMLASGEVDVVHLCTPPAGHAEQAAAVAAAGCDVIVEKPPAHSLLELDAMQHAVEKAGRRLAVVFQQRTGTAVAHVKALLDSGALGQPRIAFCHTLWNRGADYYSAPWRGSWAGEGGGSTFSHGIHQLDLLAYLLGDWSAATGMFWRLDREIETEDVATGTLVFRSGVVASVLTSVLAVKQQSALRIDTDRATIELDHLYGHDHSNWRITPSAEVPPEEAATWRFPHAEVPSSHEALLSEVYAAVRSGGPIPPVAAEAARALEIVTALYASAAEGGVITSERIRNEAPLRGPLHAPMLTAPGRER